MLSVEYIKTILKFYNDVELAIAKNQVLVKKQEQKQKQRERSRKIKKKQSKKGYHFFIIIFDLSEYPFVRQL